MTVLSVLAMLLGAFPEYTFEPGLLAGNHLALEGSPLALFHSSALLPRATRFTCSYARPFSIPELHYGALALCEGGVAFGASYFGERAYGELVLAAGKVQPVTREFTLGFALKGLILAFDEGVSEFRFTLDPSVRCELSAGTELSLSLLNAFSFFTGDPDVRPSMDASLKIREGSGLEGTLDYAMEEGMRPSLRVSQSLELSRFLGLSLGGSTEPDLFHFGFWVESIPSFQYALRIHPHLGETHAVALSFGR